MTIGGVLDQAALARLHFNVLDPEQQAQAIGRMATSGHGPETISRATGISVEAIRALLANQETAA